ncbi:hypothetical protein [Nocardia tengchongensis]|uniref:hypothetical protein n=1 Tax=Nocardia tengchongensis TaxID=2055889 RepID=UPI0036D00B59
MQSRPPQSGRGEVSHRAPASAHLSTSEKAEPLINLAFIEGILARSTSTDRCSAGSTCGTDDPGRLPIYGGFAAATDGVGKAWVSDLAPPDRQGAAQGLYQGLTGDAVLIAGI